MKKLAAFSLPEVLVALGVLAIITAVAVPQVINAIRRSDFNAAVRQVTGDARLARSLAVSKGGNYRLHAGRDPAIGISNLYNSYRLEYRSNPASAWPANSATMGTNSNVICDWQDLSILYGGVTIVSVVDGGSSAIDGAIFNSSGASVDSSNIVRSVNISVQNQDGTTKVVQIDPAGNVKIP